MHLVTHNSTSLLPCKWRSSAFFNMDPVLRRDDAVGFTLVELSIVLVIIGLIVGGILVGRDLIAAAEIRKTISEIEKTNTAVNTFRGKYNCLAGDCANATQFFGAVTEPDLVVNGDGNGVLDTQNSAYFGFEQARFYDHLAAGKLINLAQFDSESYPSSYFYAGGAYPQTPVGGGVVVGAPVAGYSDITLGVHYFYLGYYPNKEGDSWMNSIDPLLSASEAFQIDVKLDDGKPMTGKVRAMMVSTGEDPIFSAFDSPAASGTCATTASGNPYSASNDDKCALSIKAGF